MMAAMARPQLPPAAVRPIIPQSTGGIGKPVFSLCIADFESNFADFIRYLHMKRKCILQIMLEFHRRNVLTTS